MVINVSFLYPLFFLFFSPGTSDALESGQRARTHSSWGQREREIEGEWERETCDFSLYWMKSWGRLCFFCRLFLYKRSLHAVNSPVSRLAFTFLRGRRSPLCGGSEQPLRMSLWAIFDNKSIRSIVRPSSSSGDFFPSHKFTSRDFSLRKSDEPHVHRPFSAFFLPLTSHFCSSGGIFSLSQTRRQWQL